MLKDGVCPHCVAGLKSRETNMKRPLLAGSLIAAALAAASPLLGEPLAWPWKDKKPPDPALAILTSVESVTAAINKKEPATLTINVSAKAPNPGFTELQLVPRMGDPKDLIFSFEVKGRPPQDVTAQVLTDVTLSPEYSDAPIANVSVIEVYAQQNCKAFSLKDNKETECSAKSLPVPQ
jgi:hypothetical protein